MGIKHSFFNGLRQIFALKLDTVTPIPSQKLRLSGKGLQVPFELMPFELELGRQRLHVYPDLPVDEREAKGSRDILVFDPELYLGGISQALRVGPGEKLAIDHKTPGQKQAFKRPREAFRRHLVITNDDNALIFKDKISELGTYLSLLPEDRDATLLVDRRRTALGRITDIFGGPIELLPPDEAIETLRRVNRLMPDEPYRRKDSYGNPGALLELPCHLTPVLVGDLHAQLDNLLKILSENAFLEELERGTAALIFMGDAVHPEPPNDLERMDTSALMMDLIFRLKLRFPSQVFFMSGNHESFSPDVMKGGIPQSLLWGRWLAEMRGDSYRQEMELFYQRTPLVVLSDDFLACHAGPPSGKVSREKLIDARHYPNLVHELIWSRVKTRGFPAGYARADVRRFRKGLNLDKSFPFIVGHFPLSRNKTVWMNAGDIDHHHIIYSAQPNQVGIFTRVEGTLLAQVYPAEPLLDWVNDRFGPRAQDRSITHFLGEAS